VRPTGESEVSEAWWPRRPERPTGTGSSREGAPSLEDPLDPPADPAAGVPSDDSVGGAGEELAAVVSVGGRVVAAAQTAPTVTIVDSAYQPRQVEVSLG
jgi:hypothetical protein